MTGRWTSKWSVVLASSALVTGCLFPKIGTAPGPLSPVAVQSAQSRWPDASAGSLEKGRQLFLANCNGCHSYPDLSAYSDEKWSPIMSKMGRKAELSAADTDLILKFVLAARGAPAAQSPAGSSR